MMHVNVRRLVLGRRLANREFNERKIGAFEGVPAMGLDGLGSSAYGPFPGRRVAVLIPELVKQRWYQRILHSYRARRLRTQLLTYGGAALTVISVPWYLDDVASPAEAE
jgi:hypothetical protein